MTVEQAEQQVIQTARAARQAQQRLAGARPDQLTAAVTNMADLLLENVGAVVEANEADMRRAEEEGLSPKLAARLKFGEQKATDRADILQEIAELPSPVGRIDEMRVLHNGLRAGKLRCPIGVIAMIYEARPHVTCNAGALCLRSGNAVILKGGSEVSKSNEVIGDLWQRALADADLPPAAVQVVTLRGREVVQGLLEATEFIDLIIPRGGKSLIQTVSEQSDVPVIKHFEGICHVYVDADADIEKAVDVCVDGKVLMPEVCNATETVLVHEQMAADFLPRLAEAMASNDVEIRGCGETREIITDAEPAGEEDWTTEYLDLILSVKVVASLADAIAHINEYGSHHTDVIASPSERNIQRFLAEVDSAVVLSNASTMFCDGNTLGMGAEIGISTDKLHARGPMGLEELTTYKWVIQGDGHIMGLGG